MRRTYTLKSGKRLCTFVSSYGGVRIYDDQDKGKEIAVCEKKKHEDDTEYFEYDGEIIDCDNFDYMSFDELLERVEHGLKEKDKWAVYEAEALATIMRETDRVGFVMDVNCFDHVFPWLGMGFKSDTNKITALMVPFENRYKKDSWSYKIELHAENEETRRLTGSETMYFQDLWGGIMSGTHIKIVDRTKYREENPVDMPVKEGDK